MLSQSSSSMTSATEALEIPSDEIARLKAQIETLSKDKKALASKVIEADNQKNWLQQQVNVYNKKFTFLNSAILKSNRLAEHANRDHRSQIQLTAKFKQVNEHLQKLLQENNIQTERKDTLIALLCSRVDLLNAGNLQLRRDAASELSLSQQNASAIQKKLMAELESTRIELATRKLLSPVNQEKVNEGLEYIALKIQRLRNNLPTTSHLAPDAVSVSSSSTSNNFNNDLSATSISNLSSTSLSSTLSSSSLTSSSLITSRLTSSGSQSSSSNLSTSNSTSRRKRKGDSRETSIQFLAVDEQENLKHPRTSSINPYLQISTSINPANRDSQQFITSKQTRAMTTTASSSHLVSSTCSSFLNVSSSSSNISSVFSSTDFSSLSSADLSTTDFSWDQMFPTVNSPEIQLQLNGDPLVLQFLDDLSSSEDTSKPSFTRR